MTNKEIELEAKAALIADEFASKTLKYLSTLVTSVSEEDSKEINPDVVMLHTIAIINAQTLFYWDKKGKNPNMTRTALAELTKGYLRTFKEIEEGLNK